ncbi:fibroblast growth factor receptor 4-like [Nylanderia fulva]|uniref:fibroblast growth factor receptor 4-like n=1 Tax=Nylanderia fulva TaxID=613905 RepID=UPI0010FB9388|nr:fibroblast growth factor receptor 4-like [Nylanderia fulva]
MFTSKTIIGGEGLLPFRWMAPESLIDRIFTSQSDVWSFGVLMWEITSLGQHPYAALYSFNEVKEYVCAGKKLFKSYHCPEKLYDLMLNCWNAANNRPNFMSCLKTIVTLRNEIEDTILHSSPPFEYRPTADFL